MPTVRQPGHDGPHQPPRQHRSPPRPPISRLAALRAHGDLFASGPARQASNWLASAALYVGAAIAGAVWIGGGLFDVREGAAALADEAAADLGFTAQVMIADTAGRGLQGERAEEAYAAVLPYGRRSMIGASPKDMRDRLLALPWVANATVQRHWPSTIRVRLERRPAALLAARAGA